MPLILSIETATQVCSVALHNEGKVLAHTSLLRSQSHAECLLLLIEHLLAMASCQREDLDAVAISRGPGSYTGLRIGVTTAKGLCYALNIPLIAVDTLESMTCGMEKYNLIESLLCPMIDASNKAVYYLLAASNQEIIATSDVKIINDTSFQEILCKHSVLFFGSGVQKCKPVLRIYKNALFIDDIVPTAQYMGKIAYKRYQQKLFEDVYFFEPLYLSQYTNISLQVMN